MALPGLFIHNTSQEFRPSGKAALVSSCVQSGLMVKPVGQANGAPNHTGWEQGSPARGKIGSPQQGGIQGELGQHTNIYIYI